jgi:hypothetical protein
MGDTSVTAVRTAALASTAKAIVYVVFIAFSLTSSTSYPEQGLGVEAPRDRQPHTTGRPRPETFLAAEELHWACSTGMVAPVA